MRQYTDVKQMYEVTFNETVYMIRAGSVDEAYCTAYRKYHGPKRKKNVNDVYGNILYHMGCTNDTASYRIID